MSSRAKLSYAPEKRSIQYYHFSERPISNAQSAFQHYDPVRAELERIYKTKYSDKVSGALLTTLVDTLIDKVSLAHRNLPMIAAANYILHLYRNSGKPFPDDQPERFAKFFKEIESIVMPDVSKKKDDEIQDIRARVKVTILRYMLYIVQQTSAV